MSKFDGCELSAAVMLEDLFIAGQNVKRTLTNKTDAMNTAIKMRLEGQFVVIELKNRLGVSVTELVPVTFFRQMTPILK
jgi:hypothetical protein